MRTAEDIESYLIQMDAPFDTLGDGVWRINHFGTDLLISIAESVLAFRLKVLDTAKIPSGQREAFFRTLLQINASEMLHGAYGLEEDAVVVTDALQLENLDYNEFQATIDDIGLSVTNHYPTLSKFLA